MAGLAVLPGTGIVHTYGYDFGTNLSKDIIWIKQMLYFGDNVLYKFSNNDVRIV